MPPCQEYLDTGVCTADDCPNDHGLRLCKLCKIWCQGARNYEQHLQGKRHKAAERDGRPPPPRLPFACPDCGERLKHVVSATEYEAHLASERHRAAVRERDGSDRPSSPDAHCAVCSLDIFEQDRATHERSAAHTKKERFAAYQVAFSEAERDKHGVSVDQSVDFPFIDAPSGRNSIRARKSVEIKLSSTDISIELVRARLTSSISHKSWDPESNFTITRTLFPIRLRATQSVILVIDFNSESRGRFEDRLELTFNDHSLNRRFAITRNISAIVGSREDYEAIKPIAPYVPKTRKVALRATDLNIELGPKPRALADVNWVVRLLEYRIPPALEQLISTTKRGQGLIKSLKATWMPRVFSPDTYARFFRTLLHVEEAQLSVDIETFDLDDVALDIAPGVPGMYRLPVPGLAEKRPSLIVGDRILVQNVGSRSEHWWEGRVFYVRQQEVDLKFNGRFSAFRGQKFNVRFQLNRLVMRRMHQALDSQFAQPRVLFPTEDDFSLCSRPTAGQCSAIRPGERKIAENRHQLEAVAAILHHPSGSPPFIVFGPPGTGKTITIVEAMRQLTLKTPSVRILACAPSNSAADLLAERLARAGLNERELFRLNAPSRSVEQLPVFLKSYSKTNTAGTFCVPPKEDLCSFKVVVVTCVSASVPHGIGVPRGHFTHIFVDEAGQASEPEAMIAIKTLADARTNIVLAGDPKQLGPIVHSGAAQALGLQLSLLDRLMARPAYEDDMRGISFVKLTQNFRSHPTILSYPNRRFYKNELEPCGDQVTTHSFLRSPVLARAGIPIVFENIAGKDSREARSPSFFNVDEASLVKRYVQELFDEQKMRLVDEHIGVITPYHAQAGKIRTLLKKLPKGNKIKVGSVEEFQGQERRVIIISTVRSSQEHVGYDLRHTLGFVANPRRFNVAVTRAQALLIIVGDASVLSLDPLWRGFLNYVHQIGGWKGRRPDWDVDEPVPLDGTTYDRDRRDRAMSDMDAFVERTKEIVMERTRGDADGEVEWDGVVDKEWKEAE